jgi:hypothetical protein
MHNLHDGDETILARTTINITPKSKYHRHFDVFDFVRRNVLCQKVKGGNITRSDTEDFPSTKPRLGTFKTLRLERSNIRNIYPSSPHLKQDTYNP